MTDWEHRIRFESLDWQIVAPGLRQKVRTGFGRRLRLVEYSQEMAPHFCERGHIGHIVSGRLEVEFPQSRLIFERGDGVFIPAGPAHSHRAFPLTDVVVALFVEDE
jgi:ethanolamine utilization protein EutQ (cupin superfamily)